MALSHKKLLKKKQKQQKKQRAKNKAVPSKPIHELPIVAAWETECARGMMSICFARRLSNGDYHLCMYLLDLWALGVKDAYIRKASFEQYEELTERSHRFSRAEPGRLKQLLLDTVAFGRQNGFEPGGDYAKMRPFINGISTEGAEPHGMRFGDKGKVVYIANPETESAKEVKTRIATLEKTLGAGNFTCMVPEDAFAESDQPYSMQQMMYNGKPVDMNDLSATEREDMVLVTTTNEPQMFVRLYYTVRNFASVINAFDKLRCLEFMDDKVFHINYHKEAKKFGLDVGYKKIPKDMFPIILGYGHFRQNKSELTIDMRSYKRALSMIEFIDKHVDRNVLHLEEMATYNEVMSDPDLTFDDVFATIESNPQAELQAGIDALKKDDDLTNEARGEKLLAFLESQLDSPVPLVTKNPVSYYEDGIEHVETNLLMQEALAKKHASGETGYSIRDLLKESLMPMFHEEFALADLSNSVVDLCEAGKLDEADAVCERLRNEYPDQIDGLERQAMVYEERGNSEKALEYYVKTLEHMNSDPEAYDSEEVIEKIKTLKNAKG